MLFRSGKHLTPFLLGQLNTLSGGESVRVNAALLRGNAKLGAQIAVALAQLSRVA